jgi:GTPase SAR1 family protein
MRCPTLTAVGNVLRLLIRTGANILLIGLSNSGKTTLISDILNSLRKNLPNSADMRSYVINNLLDVVNSTKKAEGVFATLESLRSILNDCSHLKFSPDDKIDFDKTWRTIGGKMKVIYLL